MVNTNCHFLFICSKLCTWLTPTGRWSFTLADEPFKEGAWDFTIAGSLGETK